MPPKRSNGGTQSIFRHLSKAFLVNSTNSGGRRPAPTITSSFPTGEARSVSGSSARAKRSSAASSVRSASFPMQSLHHHSLELDQLSQYGETERTSTGSRSCNSSNKLHCEPVCNPGTRDMSRRASNSSAAAAAAGGDSCTSRSVKTTRFEELLDRPVIDIGELRDLLWSGVPEDAPHYVRSLAWKIMLGCLPLQRDRRATVAEKRRTEYMELVKENFGEMVLEQEEGTSASAEDDNLSPGVEARADGVSSSECIEAVSPPVSKVEPSEAMKRRRSSSSDGQSDAPERCAAEAKILRQIKKDLPRMNPTGFTLFSSPRIQKLMERALYCWAVRHPASGYVQGINDLLTPFIVVFLRASVDLELQEVAIDSLSNSALLEVECDVYWCLSKVLGYIQDNYIFGQPGIQRLISQLKHIVRRIDEPLFTHLGAEGLEFLEFSFRWMNCLLLREFPIEGVVRLWDTYIAEGVEGFSTFHVYVCAVFLVYWSTQLRRMDFQQMMLFMQKFPTSRWASREIETLIAEAYVLKSLFHSSPKHLNFD